MSRVVLDTDVLSSASPIEEERASKGWKLLQCLVRGEHSLLVSPTLWEEYRRVPAHLSGRRKLARFAFTRIEMVPDPQDGEARERLAQLGVDVKDVGWVLTAAEYGAVFVTWEKYAPRRRKSNEREQIHQRVVRDVESEWQVHIWHPDYALRRLCPESN